MNTTSGQHAPLIIDIAGLTLTKTDRQRLKHPLTGGLILFARNWENRAQLSALCAEIKKVRKDLLICVDHEGGRVQRFKTDGFTHLPPMRALGDMWMAEPKALNKASAGSRAGPMDATNAATACGFVLAAASGLLMFSSRPAELLANRAFVLKLSLLMGAGLNAAVFHARGGVARADGWRGPGWRYTTVQVRDCGLALAHGTGGLLGHRHGGVPSLRRGSRPRWRHAPCRCLRGLLDVDLFRVPRGMECPHSQVQ